MTDEQLPFGRLVDDGSFTMATVRQPDPPVTPVTKSTAAWVIALVIGLMALFSSYLTWRVFTYYDQMRQLHAWMGTTYLVGVTILMSVLVFLVVRTWRRYRRLLEVERLQQLAIAMKFSRDSLHDRREISHEIDRYLGRLEMIGSVYDTDLPAAIGRLRHRLREHDDPQRAMDQLEEFVLSRIDREVDSVIQRRAVETAVATALASGVLDALILCYQSTRLVDEIAGRYGSRPGWLGTARLFRRGIAMALFAEITEQASELLAEAAANKTAATVGARLAQGVSNGLLVLRFGEAVKRQCRPIACASSVSALADFVAAVWQLAIRRTAHSSPPVR